MQILSTHPSDHRGTNALKRALADIDAPGWCVAYGDRKDMCEAVLNARYEGKKIVHVGGGETPHIEYVGARVAIVHPDHWTRDAISMMSSVHFAANNWAEDYLAQFVAGPVFVTGCPSLDEIVERAKHPKQRTNEVFEWFPESVEGYKPWTGPRLSESDFLDKLQTCALFVTNSSAGLREAPILGTPVEMVGDRQAGRAPAGTYHHPEGRACEEIARIVKAVCL